MVSARAEDFFRELGVRREKSAPHTQSQNGVPERMVRTLSEAVRCMLKRSGVPKHLYGHAYKLAAHIRGVTPTSALDGATPNSLFYAPSEGRGDGPGALDHFTFGCYAVIL